MPTILSTKKLTKRQQSLLLNASISYVEYDAIQIEFLENNIPKTIKNALFTSKNAVKAVLNHKTEIENCFCVGQKTKTFLEENNFLVIETANSAKELGNKIKQQHPHKNFTFLCGNKRRDELPEILNENNIVFEEIETYKTHLNPKEFPQEFDGVLFFSPSAVQSYTAVNSLKDTKVFCIGNTTASEAKKHTTEITIANQPSVENAIVQVVKKLKK